MADSGSPPKRISVPDVKYWRVTQTKLHKVELIITINKIMDLNIGEEYESAEFYGGSENMKFCIVIRRPDYYWYKVHLKSQSEPFEAFFCCKFRLTVVSSKNEKTKNIIAQGICNSLKGLEPGGADFKSNADFLSDKYKYEEFGILCEVEFVTDVEKHFTAHMLAKNSSMGDHFGKLLDSQMFSDIKLVVGEKEFPAHKIILAARSEVFAAMFQHEMKEAESGQVLLTDVKPEVVEEMLRFIYTAESPNMKNLTDELLVIAHRYALKDLQTKAEIELVDKLSVNTAIDTLILADLHDAEFLKRETINFININSKEVMKTDEWKTTLLLHPILMQQILEANIMCNILPPSTGSLYTSIKEIQYINL